MRFWFEPFAWSGTMGLCEIVAQQPSPDPLSPLVSPSRGIDRTPMSDTPTAVLYVASHADLRESGDRALLELAQRLDRTRWTPHMIVPDAGPMAEACRQLGILAYVVPMPSCRWFSKTMRSGVRRMREIIRLTNAALLHVNGSMAMRYAGWAARSERRRVVWHVRTPESGGITDRILARLAHRIVVTSQAVARRFSYVTASRVLCVYSGVALEEYPNETCSTGEALRAQWHVPSAAPLIMSIGPFAQDTGAMRVCDTVANVAAMRPDAHWIVVGEGEERGALDARARELGVQDRLHVSGVGDDVPALLAACDLVVLPALRDGVGRVLIEAMTMRKPVVATRMGTVPEIVVPGETGLLVPPGDGEALAHAVRSLLANPDLAAYFGENGRHRVEHRFTLRRQVDEVTGVYDALVA